MARRTWEIDLLNPDRFQLIVSDNKQEVYYIRSSVLAVNYIADFIERFEFVWKRKARIFEYGDGISTVWWARNFPDNEFISVGGDKHWFDWVEEMLAKEAPHHVTHVYHEATNYYVTEHDTNFDYAHCIDDFESPFDVIINDGAQREIVGDYILSDADKYISLGGIYLRHDYEMAILGNWYGFREKLPEWCIDEKDLGYDGFTHTHPGYALVTTTGNGLAGQVMEYGGVWRKLDHKWKMKIDAEAERIKNEISNKA